LNAAAALVARGIMKVMIRAVIFDCFGVLVGKGFDETYRSVGGDPDVDREFVSALLARSNHGLISQDDFHAQITDQLKIAPEDWDTAVIKSERPDQVLIAYIKQLHEHFKTAILSNANRGVVQSRIGVDCLDSCFDAVIVSAEVGRVKPEREIYEFAAKSLAVELDECIFIDDLEGFVNAANDVGMHAILFKNVDQAKADIELLITQYGK
jgi:putative hydrolase of the HAD superfamily